MRCYSSRAQMCGVLIGLLSLGGGASGWAQGPLSPPGAPAATMRSLAQVEPRLPVSSAPATISQPGSYYLTTNLTGTITIDTDCVTLDLMGFRIHTAGSSIAIPAGRGENTVIRNGTLSMASGAGIALDARYLQNSNSRFEDLRIDGNGTAWAGIYAGSGCLVRNCEVVNCNNYGIIGNSSFGGLEVRDCRITKGLQDGVSVYRNSRVVDNVIEYNGGDGLLVSGTGSYIAGNLVRNNTNNYNLADGNQLNLLLSQVPENINWPCSIKFAGTLICSSIVTNGITVSANDVTIDMDGHALVGPGASSLHGIYQGTGFGNLQVRNGHVRNWGGINRSGINAAGKNNCIEQLHVMSNYNGLVVSYGGSVVHCHASRNANYGISAILGSRISDCVASHNAGHGFYLDGGCSISECVASYNTLDGIYVWGACRVENNMCDNNGYLGGNGAGIHVLSTKNRVEGNTVLDNDRGLDIDNIGNSIAGNVVRDNTDNYDILPGNQLHLLLSEVPETLDWPCHAQLAGTLTCISTTTNGITVNADDVTIDLGGQALIGPGAAGGHGISQDQRYSNLRVCNGMVRNWLNTSRNGINAMGKNTLLENIQCASNYTGIAIANGGVVSKCTAVYNSEFGIYAVYGCEIAHCSAYRNDTGFYLYEGCQLSDCTAYLNTSNGITAYLDNRLSGNKCDGNWGAGFYVSNSDNHLENNSATDNARGFQVRAGGNLIVRNSASGNTLNWAIAAGNVCLVHAAATCGAISGDFGGTAPGSTDPSVNFTY